MPTFFTDKVPGNINVEVQTESSTIKNQLGMAEDENKRLANENEKLMGEKKMLTEELSTVNTELERVNKCLANTETGVSQDENNVPKQEYEKIETEKDSLTEELSAVNTELERVNKCLSIKKNENTILNQTLKTENDEKAALATKLNVAETENTNLERRLTAQSHVIQNMKKNVSKEGKHGNEDLVAMEKKLREVKNLMDTEIRKSINLQNELQLRKTNEVELRKLVSARELDIKEIKQKFEEAGNPDFDHLTNLENCMKNQLLLIGDSIKESLTVFMEEKLGTLQANAPSELTEKMESNKTTNT